MLKDVVGQGLSSHILPTVLQNYQQHQQNPVERPKVDFHDLYDEPKFAERKAFLNAMETAYRKLCTGHDFSAVILGSISRDQLKKDFQDKLHRLFVLLFITEKNPTVESAIEEVRKLDLDAEAKKWMSPKKCQKPRSEIKKLADKHGILPSSKKTLFHRYLNEIENEIPFLKDENAYHREIQDIQEALVGLDVRFNKNLETSEDYRINIYEILQCLRNLMNNNIYRISKTNESHLLTKLAHVLSFAGYHDTPVSKKFEEFGKKVLKVTQVSPDLPIEKKIEMTWKKLHDEGIPADILGAVEKNFSGGEKMDLAGEYTAYGLAGFTRVQIFEHDERRFPDNVPGSLYEEKCEFSCAERTDSCWFRAIYTCNPTIGSYVAPEYLAVLQGMENRYFSPVENDAYPYLYWDYVNLQNFASRNENQHATVLMRLNKEYPLSFRGITVTQNSPFFAAAVEVFDEEYKNEFLKELLHEKNFTLKDRSNDHGGLYYFPSNDKKLWEDAMRKIVSLAYGAVDGKRLDRTQEELGAAFKELVHLGIMRYSQQLSLEKARSLTNRENILAIVSRVCKSCIDRGGKITNEHFVALSTEAEDDIALGAFQGRPILVARRLLLEQYTSAFYNLFKVLPRAIIKDYFGIIGKTVSQNSRLSTVAVRTL